MLLASLWARGVVRIDNTTFIKEKDMSDGMSEMIEEENALKKQIGGRHYTSMEIQPMEYSMANGLDACQHTIVKYVSRFREKGGIEDLKKAIHCIEMLMEFEYGTGEGYNRGNIRATDGT